MLLYLINKNSQRSIIKISVATFQESSQFQLLANTNMHRQADVILFLLHSYNFIRPMPSLAAVAPKTHIASTSYI